MSGAIIGDLAAWTWKNDHECFYPQLVSPQARLSEYGRTLLITANALMREEEMPIDEYRKLFPFDVRDREHINSVVRAIAIAWLYEDEEELRHAIKSYCLWDNKEELYAASFMAEIIYALRHGATKKEAGQVELCGTFCSFVQDDNWQKGTGTLSMVVRAWNAFHDAFDYTSALHNAMKLPGDRHVNTILTGAFAEAMYGCEMTLLKKRYRPEGNWYNHIELPHKVSEEYAGILDEIKLHKEKVRVFFPKNRALTNVELHKWTMVENPFKDRRISDELRRRILKAYDTGWEARYGFYLDDGWIYVYRSGFLLHRFQLQQSKDGLWNIIHLQRSEASQSSSMVDITDALYVCEYGWHQESCEQKPSEPTQSDMIPERR